MGKYISCNDMIDLLVGEFRNHFLSSSGAFEMCPQLAGVTENRFLVTFARFGTTNTRVFDRHTESLYNNT